MTLAIAGSAVGFLPYNFNPAKIFMGDTGSLFLGYMLAAISIDGAVKGAAALAIVVPVLALGLPIFDTTFAIVRRAWNGKAHHGAGQRSSSPSLAFARDRTEKTVLILYIISAALGVSATLISEDKVWIRFLFFFSSAC